MADIDTSYGTKAAITITLTSLADGSSRQSTTWDMTSGNAIDFFVMCQTNGQSGGVDYCYLNVFGGLDTTSNEFTDNAGASDAAFTTANILNSPMLGSIKMNAATAVAAGPYSIASAFGGLLPAEGGIIVNNESGAALSATASDHDFEYLPIYLTSA